MTHILPTQKLPPTALETERLALRTPVIEDAWALHHLAARDECFANATVGHGDNTLESACTAIIRMLNDLRAGNGAWWIVLQKSSGKIVGLTGFSSRHEGGKFLTALAAKAHGRGFAQEMTEAILRGSSPAPLQNAYGAASERNTPPLAAPAHTRWYWQNKHRHAQRGSDLQSA